MKKFVIMIIQRSYAYVNDMRFRLLHSIITE